MRILVTNDDGFEARGICVLVKALADWADLAPAGETREIVVLAPNKNHSGAATAVGEVFNRDGIDYHRVALRGVEHVEAYALDAPPALCVIVGCRGAFGPRPDLIVSGINAGINVGNSVLHSGTIGAVLTGSQIGVSGLAVSMQAIKHAPYETAAHLAIGVLEDLSIAPVGTVFSLNVPALAFDELKGIRHGRVATAGIIKEAMHNPDGSDRVLKVGEKGKLELRLGAAVPALGDVSSESSDTDDGALVANGYATLTALRTVHDDTEPESEAMVRAAISATEQHITGIS